VLWLLTFNELQKVVLFLTHISYKFVTNKQDITIVTIFKLNGKASMHRFDNLYSLLIIDSEKIQFFLLRSHVKVIAFPRDNITFPRVSYYVTA